MPKTTVRRFDDAGGDEFAVFDDGATGAKSQGVTLCDDDGAPIAKLPVSLAQEIDPNNTKTIAAADAQPGTPWVGAWTQTRSLGIVRQLIVITSSDPAVGGTFTLEFGEDGVNAIISEARVIDDFATVRDFDLINAGEYFRVKFEPTNPLGADLVYLTTTQRRQNDGAFARLANQEIEEANAAMGQTFAYQKHFNQFTGKSENVRSDAYVPAFASTTPLGAGASYDTGIVDCRSFNYVGTELVSDVAGSLTAYFYQDLAGTTLLRQFTRPYSAGEGFAFFGSVLTRPYVRYVFTNGATPQTIFHMATRVMKNSLTGQVLGLNDFVPANILTSVGRNMIMGNNPSGVAENVRVNASGGLFIAAAKSPTYFASCRGTGSPFTLTIAPTVATPANVVAFWHEDTSVMTAQLRYMELFIAAVQSGATVNFELVRISGTPTGGVAVAPAKANSGDPGHEMSIVTGPSAGMTLGNVMVSFPLELANADKNKGVTLYNMSAIEPSHTPTLRAGVAEGYLLRVTTSSTVTMTGIVNMRFTEAS